MGKRQSVFILLAILLLGVLAVLGGNYLAKRSATLAVREHPVVGELRLESGQEAPDFEQGEIFFVGNATVIIKFAGFTILTDPNFLHAGDHAHLGYGIQAKRLTNPAIELEQLPPIDLVVLSHMHGDHFDQVVKKKLDKALPVITTPAAENELKTLGFRSALGLNHWESIRVQKGGATLDITALPGKHGPGLTAHALPEVNGHLLNFKKPNDDSAYKLYISGDTIVYDDLKQIPRQFPIIDLALLHLGGTRVLGLTVTMDAKQGVKALEIIAPKLAIPIHYNDYDRFKSSLEAFQQAVRKAGMEARVKYLKPGETYRFEGRR